MFDRLRRRSVPTYDELVKVARASKVVGLDESGHRQDGAGGWMWLMRTDRVSVFRVEMSRGAWVAEAMLGADFKGVVCSDFYGVYTSHDDWVHGYCGAHTIREAKKLAELEPCAETEDFRDRLTAFYVAGKAAAKSRDASERRGARIRLGHIIGSTNWVAFPDIVRLQERLDVHKAGVTLFIDRPDVRRRTTRPSATSAPTRDIARDALDQRQQELRSLDEHHADASQEHAAAPRLRQWPVREPSAWQTAAFRICHLADDSLAARPHAAASWPPRPDPLEAGAAKQIGCGSIPAERIVGRTVT